LTTNVLAASLIYIVVGMLTTTFFYRIVFKEEEMWVSDMWNGTFLWPACIISYSTSFLVKLLSRTLRSDS